MNLRDTVDQITRDIEAGHAVSATRDEAKLWFVLLRVVEEVYRRHQQEFYVRLSASPVMRGTVRRHASGVRGGITHPKQIGDSHYWVEISCESGNCVTRARELLQLFGHSRNELELVFLC